MTLERILLRPEADGERLDQFLATELPKRLGHPLSKAKVRKLIVAGAVYLNDRRVRIASKPLHKGAKVSAHIRREELMTGAERVDRPFHMTQADVLFEDEYIIAVAKPPGLPTQPTVDDARANLVRSVTEYLAARQGVAKPYLGLHHRLDRDTSGVILFAKSKAANPGLARSFAERQIEKTYHAVVAGAPRQDRWSVRNFLGRVGGKRFGSVRAGGDPAETEFRRLGPPSQQKACWIEAKPLTGRTHQIRIHLAEAGTPILGDDLYSTPASRSVTAERGVQRLLLHARSLKLKHPVTGADLVITCELPEDFRGAAK